MYAAKTCETVPPKKFPLYLQALCQAHQYKHTNTNCLKPEHNIEEDRTKHILELKWPILEPKLQVFNIIQLIHNISWMQTYGKYFSSVTETETVRKLSCQYKGRSQENTYSVYSFHHNC